MIINIYSIDGFITDDKPIRHPSKSGFNGISSRLKGQIEYHLDVV